LTEPAIECFLEEQFASLAEAAPSAYAESAYESALTLIAALVDLDLLSPEDSEEWIARLARALPDPLDRPLATPQLRRQANEYIDRCLAEIAPGDGEGSNDHWRVYGALEAFVEVGLLTGHDFEQWQRQLWQRDAISDSEESLDVASRFDMTHLMLVVPGPDERVGGLRVTVVELYRDGVSVQWHRAPGGNPRRHRRRARRQKLSLLDDPPMRVIDQFGTAYRWAGGGSSHGSKRGEGELGRTDFVPTVPEQMRQLLIQIGAEALVVSLY
jgi:hypothetical protein